MSEQLQEKAARLEMMHATRKAFADYVERNRGGDIKLTLATGPHSIDGWFCTDIVPNAEKNIYYCDITQKFAFESESFDFIYCEHGIEHVTFESGLQCLSECYRVLKKGGVLRISTPSLEKWINYYLVDSEAHDRATMLATHIWLKNAKECQLFSKCLVFNNAMRNWGHTILYDFQTLERILLGLKFTEVVSAGIGESRHAALRDMERHCRDLNAVMKEYNAMEIMVLEAGK